MRPLVSVVICNYNYAQYLEDAIRSALSQTYEPIEIIVVDDGSTDNSQKVLERQPPSVVRLQTLRQGQTGALWAGVQASHGDIVCFLDSDDIWHPSKIEEVAAVFETHEEIDWVRHKLNVTDATCRTVGPNVPRFTGSGPVPKDPYQYLERTVTVSTSALSIRRALAMGAFSRLITLLERSDESARFGAEAYNADAFLLALIGALGARGFSLDRPLGKYRRHAGQQFCEARGALPMLEKQIEIGVAISRIWSQIMGGNAVGSHVYKHLLVAETLRGRNRWSATRLKLLGAGTGAALRLARSSVRLSIRQVLALTYAYLTPNRWHERVLREHGYQLGADVSGAQTETGHLQVDI